MGSREAIARALMDLPAGVVRWASAPAERLPRVSSGIATLDAALGGGWPKGRVATLQARFATGLATGGATAIAASSVADATARGLLAAWIDGDGSLDPASLAAAGADLERVLWVRGPLPADRVLSAAEEVLRAGGFDVLVLRLPRGPRRLDAAWARLDAAWARVSRAAAAARAAVLVAGAGTAAGPIAGAVTVSLDRTRGQWAAGLPGSSALLLGASVAADVDGREATAQLPAPEALAEPLRARPVHEWAGRGRHERPRPEGAQVLSGSGSGSGTGSGSWTGSGSGTGSGSVTDMREAGNEGDEEDAPAGVRLHLRSGAAAPGPRAVGARPR